VSFLNLVVDKVDLHLAMDLEDDLISLGGLIQPYLMSTGSFPSKVVLTTNEQEKAENFAQIKSGFFEKHPSVTIKLRDQTKSSSRYESVGHLVVE
jgi:hypothetical protein